MTDAEPASTAHGKVAQGGMPGSGSATTRRQALVCCMRCSEVFEFLPPWSDRRPRGQRTTMGLGDVRGPAGIG